MENVTVVSRSESINSGMKFTVVLTDYKGENHSFELMGASPSAVARQAQDYLWNESREQDRKSVASILVILK